MEQEQTVNPPAAKKKFQIKFVILPLILLGAAYFGYTKWDYARKHEVTDNATIETSLMPVLTRVSGYVKTISVNDYDTVHAGQLLVELDDAEMQAQLNEMEADLRSTLADVANAQASVNQANVGLGVNAGNMNLNKIRINKAQSDFERDKTLFEQGAITKKQFEDSKFNLEQSKQQLSTSGADMSGAQSKIAVLQSNVNKAASAVELKKARIEQQKLKISYNKIIASISGKIGKKNISIGQFVQPGTPMFTIVNDSTYWVIANFKENQISRFHEGMKVDIELDAYPELKLTGHIESLSDATGSKTALLPADNASGNYVKVTQRLPVKIAIDNLKEHKAILRAGFSAKVVVPLQN